MESRPGLPCLLHPHSTLWKLVRIIWSHTHTHTYTRTRSPGVKAVQQNHPRSFCFPENSDYCSCHFPQISGSGVDWRDSSPHHTNKAFWLSPSYLARVGTTWRVSKCRFVLFGPWEHVAMVTVIAISRWMCHAGLWILAAAHFSRGLHVFLNDTKCFHRVLYLSTWGQVCMFSSNGFSTCVNAPESA